MRTSTASSTRNVRPFSPISDEVVVDTNIFVSAALKEVSWPANTLRWIAKYGGLIRSEVTEHEVIAVQRRPRLAPKITPSFLDQLHRVLVAAELVTITERVAACRDPDDDKFLELAVNGRADVIKSGDDDLLVLDTFRGIPIITAAAFGRAQELSRVRPDFADIAHAPPEIFPDAHPGPTRQPRASWIGG
jgi:uncharacterized protein